MVSVHVEGHGGSGCKGISSFVVKVSRHGRVEGRVRLTLADLTNPRCVGEASDISRELGAMTKQAQSRGQRRLVVVEEVSGRRGVDRQWLVDESVGMVGVWGEPVAWRKRPVRSVRELCV